MKKEMLINVLQPEECRIAILEDGVLEELYVERTSHESYVGNIYKGRIVNIEPSIQAAFVDFGVGRNGFLHVSDVDPQYYRHKETGEGGGRGRDSLRDILDLPDIPMVAQEIEDVEDVEDEEEEESPAAADEVEEEDDDRDGDAGDEDDLNEGDEVDARSAAEDEMRDALLSGDEQDEEDTAVDDEDDEGEAGPPDEGLPRMPGAERRTEEPDDPAGPGGSDLSDVSDVLFSAPKPPARPARAEARPEPRPEPRPEARAEPRAEAPREESGRPERPAPEPRAEGRTADRSSDRVAPDDRPPAERSEGPQGEAPRGRGREGRRRGRRRDSGRRERGRDDAAREAQAPDRGEAAEERPAGDETDEMLTGRRPEEESADELAAADAAEARAVEAEEDLEVMSVRGEEDDGGDRRGRRGGRRGRGPRRGGRNGPVGRPKPPIQEIFRRGQEVLVQVIKEGIGTKGPTLSTYISIPGRYLVLMPGLNRIGVSRKIVDEEQRRRLREILDELKPPKGLGFIIRTAGLDRTKKELQRDLAYLTRLWKVIVRRIKKLKAPAAIYQESDMITRTIRDIFTSEIETIRVDEPEAFAHAQEFLQVVMPRYAQRIQLYADSEPLFYRYGIEQEINRIQDRRVPLPTGGSLVIDQTEALVAIDVNSGNFRADNDAEQTAYRINLMAAKEIARQLRLRDLGGVVVMDFIDMREERHRRDVERTLRDAVRRDRARTKILRMSAFGIIEMTRQRIRPSLKRSVYTDCPACNGTGQVKTSESMSIEVMRLLQLASHRPAIAKVSVRVAEPVAQYLLNKKRKEISQLEESGKMQVTILGAVGALPETLDLVCSDANGNDVKLLDIEPPASGGGRDRGGRRERSEHRGR